MFYGNKRQRFKEIKEIVKDFYGFPHNYVLRKQYVGWCFVSPGEPYSFHTIMFYGNLGIFA